MIINLRGTNGSGKSTIVRKVMEHYPMTPMHLSNRRQPIGYYGIREDGQKLWVVGHYETDCGGCDTITSLDEVYKEVRQADNNGFNVLYEGIMVSGEFRRCVELLKEGRNVLVLALDIPIQTCIEGINNRRAKKENPKPLNPDRTIRRLGEVRRMMEHLKVCHVPTQWTTREEALGICLTLFGVSDDH